MVFRQNRPHEEGRVRSSVSFQRVTSRQLHSQGTNGRRPSDPTACGRARDDHCKLGAGEGKADAGKAHGAHNGIDEPRQLRSGRSRILDMARRPGQWPRRGHAHRRARSQSWPPIQWPFRLIARMSRVRILPRYATRNTSPGLDAWGLVRFSIRLARVFHEPQSTQSSQRFRWTERTVIARVTGPPAGSHARTPITWKNRVSCCGIGRIVRNFS